MFLVERRWLSFRYVSGGLPDSITVSVRSTMVCCRHCVGTGSCNEFEKGI